MHGPHREFLEAVRDGKDVFAILKKHDIGYGWAINESFVWMHPAYFEFTLTAKGATILAAR